MLGFIKRNTVKFKHINALKTLFFTLVRSHLVFGSKICSSIYITFFGLLKNVQHKFLKVLIYKLNFPFTLNNWYLVYFLSGIW